MNYCNDYEEIAAPVGIKIDGKMGKIMWNLIAQFFVELGTFLQNKAENMRAYFLGSVAALNSFGSKWKLYFSKIYLIIMTSRKKK